MKPEQLNAIVAMAMVTLSTTTGNAQIPCRKTPTKIDVAANQLDKALLDLSGQIDCKLKYNTKLTKPFRSQIVNGNLMPSDALIQLVKGTGLEVHSEQDTFSINQTDQQEIGLKAATLQAGLGQAIKAQTVDKNRADRMCADLGAVRNSVVELAKIQGFVSAAEKASYKRTFAEVEQLLAPGKKG